MFEPDCTCSRTCNSTCHYCTLYGENACGWPSRPPPKKKG